VIGPPRRPDDHAPVRCLVADDHPAIVEAVSRVIERDPDVELVGRAGDGDEALRLIEALRPDVALLDIRMPNRTGIDIARELGSIGVPTAVILYTELADTLTLVEAIDAGARGFVLKGSPLVDLSRAIRLVAAGGVYVDPALAGALASAQATDRFAPLTKREREVLRLLADGLRNEQIARRLSISPLTVRSHVKNAMVKLEAGTRTQAVARALRESLIS
jgi:DNA-binding NarL/FixJ family response regulator